MEASTTSVPIPSPGRAPISAVGGARSDAGSTRLVRHRPSDGDCSRRGTSQPRGRGGRCRKTGFWVALGRGNLEPFPHGGVVAGVGVALELARDLGEEAV